MPIHLVSLLCCNLRFFSSDKLKTPKKKLFSSCSKFPNFHKYKSSSMKKDSYPWIYDESISLFFLKKRCKDFSFWHRFNKNCKCTMQKIRNCVWFRFYSKFYWKRIEQIQIVQPECDGIWKLILVYKLLKKILHKISQFKTIYVHMHLYSLLCLGIWQNIEITINVEAKVHRFSYNLKLFFTLTYFNSSLLKFENICCFLATFLKRYLVRKLNIQNKRANP